ncbi:MAG: iron-sulfur cluster assembly accessory protein [Magnetococcales bacterium]|nr:iron-sulfur cluster assembly accessory protein [Magnetococcales bacterium]MBF0439393.1 iron-sulfur cluster assembly accessory protein [Magnetococcales bacterium]
MSNGALQGVTFSERAARQVQLMLNKRGTPDAAIRIGTTTAGCSGFSYKLEYADLVEEGDQVFEASGIKVVLDGKAAVILDGTVVDFESTPFKSGFKFSNPKEKERCGCGESFKV